MRSYRGRCHCGELQLTYQTSAEPKDWNLRVCGCSFCRVRAAVYTSDSNGEIEFVFGHEASVLRYQFATKTAEFLLCGVCDGYLGAVTRTPDGARGVVNVRVLEDVVLDFGRAVAMNFDGESLEQRQARWARSWTPVKPN